jgi:Mg-chelatase subunit ChlD
VAILIDTSGSMGQSVRGADGRDAPKYQIARRALERIIQHTAEWKKRHPDHHLELAIYRFSSSVSPVLAMGEFDPDKARAALNDIPAPHGGTAIGAALEEGYRALFQSGCTRKFIVCVTDGENTSGPPPSVVAVNLDQQTSGAVRLEFVAFNTSARQFQFLHRVNGQVVEAANGPQLEAELKKIYEQRILKAEADEPEK